MTRKLTTFVLAGFYLLQATWLLHAGMDLLLPGVREAVASVSDSCCTNACGCPEEIKLANGCCCVKHAAAEAPAKKQTPVSALEAARCKGVEEAMTQAFTQPVVCSFDAIGYPIAEASRASLPDLQPLFSYRSTDLDKVPIAQA